MDAIEVITSQTESEEVKNETGEVIGTVDKIIWNPTVANLSLMALGSSAPEIMLSVIETVTLLGYVPGELGPSTIVGSGAFNLLIITAVSIMAVDEKMKKIDDVGVFMTTSFFSVFAYIWMWLTLEIISPGVIQMWEAIFTLLCTLILLLSAYGMDRCRRNSMKDGEEEDEEDEDGEDEEEELARKMAKSALRILARKKGDRYVIECVTGGKNIDAEDKTKCTENFKKVLSLESLDTVDVGSLVDALKADNINERIAFRKAASAGAGKRERDKASIMVTQLQGFDEGKDNFMPNPNVGFKSMNYVCSESVGTLEIKICKKVQEELVFVVKTQDGSATQPKKYEKVEEIVKMTKTQNEHIVKVTIVDDDDYNEDQDFYVEICNEEGRKLEGDDCSTRVTIKDEDKPGEIGFDKKKYTVRKMDKYAYIQLVRKDGSTGEASCYCKTEVLTKQVNNQAEEFTDFMPFNDPITFKNGETE
jgi:solute carrier family 8 (sodium/calcium exchanger)